MKKVGLTGGIGVGKTYIARIFKQLGCPIFFADYEAKICMQEIKELRNEINKNFGDLTFKDGVLQTDMLARVIFNDNKKIKLINRIVHPYVIDAFNKWCEMQEADFVIKEAAILFESNSIIGLDKIICVSAPIDLRIKRVMIRDKCSKDTVIKKIQNQMSEDEKMKLSDFVIVNNERERLLTQIINIYNELAN